jgi:hypothetical protein
MDGKIKPTDALQYSKLFQAYALIKETKIFDNLDDAQLIKVLLWCESKGWLYYRFERQKVIFVACMYNIHKFDEKTCYVVPIKSEGNILFVPFLVNISGENIMPKQVLTEYLQRYPNTTQIVFYKGDSKQPTILTKKETK